MENNKTPNNDYWIKRFEQLQEKHLSKGEDYIDDLEREYRKAQLKIEKEIESFYQRLADNNNIEYADVKQLLDKNELEEFHWTVEEYIKKGRENAISQQWMKQLENASNKVRISRLEALQISIEQEIELLSIKRNSDLFGVLSDIYEDGFYESIFEIQKGFEFGTSFTGINKEIIESIINKSWAPDGSNFSDRIWRDKNILADELQRELAQAFIRGDAPDDAIRNIADTMSASRKAASRLVMTESAFFAGESRKRAYKELGVEEYQISSTLDYKTSKVCQDMDRKIFKVSEYMPGITAPPFHPNCRTTTIPYFKDNHTQRFARGSDGKGYSVDGKMSYKEWRESLTEDENGKLTLKSKMEKNYKADLEQYEKYKELLGNDLGVKDFTGFQNMKYNNVNKWEEKKSDYRYANMLRNRKIVEHSKENSSLGLEGDPNSITDLVKNGEVKQRKLYGEDRKTTIAIDTNDHNLPKYHSMGAHKHVYDYSKSNPHSKPLYFTEEELRQNKDIIKKGVNYFDDRDK